ncbi:B3 domain-containing protein Os01g0234100-like [Camellia sinensis]|uniref:B3 domain-containing protein Os01g0234100-like n=1 Tax=Camellia sinensis TaxID=4442 RepID=UPI0010360389|nr:B3 domain-containing protein Os01g0234100-like [Camellia sinensis]
MRSESAKEGLVVVVGSKMKIRLSHKHQSKAIDLHNTTTSNNNHDDDDVDDGAHDHQEVKKEVVSEHSMRSAEDNLTLAQLSNSTSRTLLQPSTPSPLSTGKRKKKPKELNDDFFYVLVQKKMMMKNKASVSKPNPVVVGHARKSMSCKRRKTATYGLHSPVQVKTPTMIRAEEVQSSLGSEFPSFTKLLVRSHVASCFWMGLPVPFCKLHLPRNDTTFTLEDESGEQFELKFIAEKPGLSAGWRKFAVGHKLLEGDVLIFQLVESNKFKVYIVRANDLTEVDGALSLLNLDALTKQNDSGKDDSANGGIALNNKKRKRTKSLPLALVQKKNKKTTVRKSVPKPIQPVEQFENDSEDVGSEVLVGPKSSGSATQFRDIKSFDDFTILFDGFCIDSELPEHTRVNYYELCRSKNTFIHARLIQGLNCKLVAGIICETVNIANDIRACKLTTSRDEFAIWEKTLKSFELMGMDVGFLRARVCHLLSMAFESEGALDTRQYMEAETERDRAEYEIRNLEAKLVELKAASEKLGVDVKALKSKAESYEHKFQKEVDAPW